jgi:hypothetical protein
VNADILLADLRKRGIRIEQRTNGNLYVTPKSRLTPELIEQIRTYKHKLLAVLTPGPPLAIPDSRRPLICTAVRAKLEAIEAEARRLGWPAELLWNSGYWGRPRGLAAILEPGNEIVEVTADAITILKVQRDMQTFRRHGA